MAAATLGSTTKENVGSLTLHIIELSSVADTNTHATGLPNVVAFWAQGQASETAGEEGVNVTNSSGTFTFGLKTTGAVTLFVLSKS
jgi:hypothetical protein